jgi:hypothetical protein
MRTAAAWGNTISRAGLLLGRSLPRREPAMNEGFAELGLPLALDLGVERLVLPAPNVIDLVPFRHHHVHGRLRHRRSHLRPEVARLALGKLSHRPQIALEVLSIGGLTQVEPQVDEDRHSASLVIHGAEGHGLNIRNDVTLVPESLGGMLALHDVRVPILPSRPRMLDPGSALAPRASLHRMPPPRAATGPFRWPSERAC